MERLYITKIQETVRQFGITSVSFRAEPAKVLASTMNSLIKFQAPLDHPDTDIRILFAIAAQDGINAISDGKHVDLPLRQYEYYRYYAIDNLGKPSTQNVGAETIDQITYLKTYYDARASRNIATQASSWGLNSRLRDVRNFFGITPDIEKPYNVLALNRNSEELAREWGKRGSMIFLDGQNFTVVDRDGMSFEHEYGHSQGVGMLGLRSPVFHSLEEGLVEQAVRCPQSYPDHRQVIEGLLMFAGNNAKSLMTQTHIGTEGGRDRFLANLIKKGGLSSLIYLGWMGNSTQKAPYFISPKVVVDFVADNFVDTR